MSSFNMNSVNKGKINAVIILWDFIVLWYYFFSASIKLRPFASLIWIALVVIGAIIFNVRLIKIDRYLKLCLFAVLILFLSVLFSVDKADSLKYAFSILLYLAVAYEICSSYENIVVFLKLAIPFVIVHCVIMLIQIARPDLYISLFLPLLPREFQYRILGFMARGAFTGFTNQTSSIADILGLSVGILIYHSRYKQGLQKWMYLIISIICILLLGLTERRWSTVVVLVLMLFAISTLVHNRIIKTLIFCVAIALGVSGVLSSLSSSQSIINKMISEVNAGDVTNGRISIWSQTIELIKNRPFTGYGANTFQSLIPNEANAHNSFLQAWLELGLFGAIIFFLPFFYGIHKTIQVYRLRDRLEEKYVALVFFSLYWQLYCMLDAIFESFFSSELSVFMLFFAQLILIREKQCYEMSADNLVSHNEYT